ncbi:dTDP-glucose 4,6-dehydratase [Echinicola jeungdonensis]|uniref:dTDP-glucose 4,6-dehydratase n=1 Tax=Echinicola jeungdonensis TaxID=709343 RepID=A0ABV5J516_9BACT|nr:dTDP-glucose 4,6-dehydratase [Echinicola jeungdonensis]MDN3670087.1 dTDP-glucose 4,6-dehydratase [Echinicola jeungdonensis]
MKKTILITGGAGFIGSHVVQLFVKKYPYYNIVNLDCLTYAGNLENLQLVENEPNYYFSKVNLLDEEGLKKVFHDFSITDVIHLAAESHVDRSISDPLAFVKTNVLGTVNLLNAAKTYWKELDSHLFYHVSTDEVYGSLGKDGYFMETTAYDPKSPYSASKASSDHFVRAYANTFKINTVISNCSNNYGPNQFPEKLIPLCINNIQHERALPIYGKGENVRDWLYVEDHAQAIDLIFHKGKRGETYNIGGWNEWKNIDIVKLICNIMDKKLGKEPGSSAQLIKFVKDRAGHDLRYAIDATKLQEELGWRPSLQFEEGIEKTIDWYLKNQQWLENVTSGNYKEYYAAHYQSPE